MPVTVKLSRKFYDTFGDEVVNEMVDLLNLVDRNAQDTVRQVNEANALRFDRMEQGLAEVRAEVGQVRNDLAALKAEMPALRAEVGQDIAAVRADLVRELATLRAELLKWSFLFWVGTLAAVVGLTRF